MCCEHLQAAGAFHGLFVGQLQAKYVGKFCALVDYACECAHKYPFSVLISCFPFSVLRRPPSPLHALLAHRPSSTNPTLQYSSPWHTLA